MRLKDDVKRQRRQVPISEPRPSLYWFPEREYATAVGLTFAANPLGAAIGTPIVAWLLVLSTMSGGFPFSCRALSAW